MKDQQLIRSQQNSVSSTRKPKKRSITVALFAQFNVTLSEKRALV